MDSAHEGAGDEESESSGGDAENEMQLAAPSTRRSVRVNLSPMEEFTGMEPLVNISMNFQEAHLFKDTYYKNQRSSLRCFPQCSVDGHQRFRFCGRPLRVSFTIKRRLDLVRPFNPREIYFTGSFSSRLHEGLIEDLPANMRSEFVGDIESMLPEETRNGALLLAFIVVFNIACKAWKMPSHSPAPERVFSISVDLPLTLLDPDDITPRYDATHIEMPPFCSPPFLVKWFRAQSELPTAGNQTEETL